MKFHSLIILCLFLSTLSAINGFQVRSDPQAGTLNGLKSIALQIPTYVKSFFQTKQVVDQIEDKQNSIQDALDALLKVQNTTNHQVEHAQERVEADYQNCSEAIESLNCINLPIWQVQKDKHSQNSSIIQNDIFNNQDKINQIKELIRELMSEKKEAFSKIEPKLKKVTKNIEVLKNIIKMAEENFNLTNSFAQISSELVVFSYPETYSFLQSKIQMKETEKITQPTEEGAQEEGQQANANQSDVDQGPGTGGEQANNGQQPPENAEPQQQQQGEQQQQQQQEGEGINSLQKPKIDNKSFQLFKDQLKQLENMKAGMDQEKNDIENDINNRKSQLEADLQDILNVNSELKQQLSEKKQEINELEQQIRDCDYEKQLNQFCEQQKSIQQDFLEDLVQEQALVQSAIDETNILINQAVQEGIEASQQIEQNAQQQQ